MLASVLAAACLTPTDGGSRFGELRVQPAFSAGMEPAAIDITIDSVHAIVQRSGSTDVLVDTLMRYDGTRALGWVLELVTVADDMDVSLELRSGGEPVYQGERAVTVSEGTIGRAELEDVPVAYIGSTIASRIDVVPARVAFTAAGMSRQLDAIVYDDRGVVISGKSVTWTSDDPSVATVDASGIVTAAGTDSTTIQAAADGVVGSAVVIVDGTLAQHTEIAADSVSIAADGASATLVTVTIRNAQGDPVGASAGTVTLASTLGTMALVTDHDDGTYTATLTAGTVAGTALISGTLDGVDIADTASVDLRPTAPVPNATTLEADSAFMTANGTSRTRITVTVRDANGNAVGTSAGVVALSTTLGQLGAVTDHDDGTYTATLTTGTKTGTAVVTGTLDGAAIADTVRIDLRPAAANPTTTTIEADSAALPADGSSSTLITVTVRDANGNPTGSTAGVVTLATTLGALTAVTDQADGTYTARLTAGTVAGTAIVTGTLAGAAIEDSAFITLRPLTASPTTTTIDADSTFMTANGVSATLITVTVRDANGNLVSASAGPVTLATTLGSLSASGVKDNGDGTYTDTLTAGTVTGMAVVTGTLGGAAIGDSAQVELRPGAADPTTTTIDADSTSIAANGISTTIVTVAVLDSNGNPVGASAGNVTLSTTIGILSTVTDVGDGTYTAALRADTTALSGPAPDTATVTGTLNGVPITDAARVEFRHEPGNPLMTTIDADSATLVAGAPTWTTVRVTVRDAAGNRVHASAGAVTLTTTRGRLGPVTDHGDGTYTAELEVAGDSGTAVITGTLNGVLIADSAVVDFVAAVPAPDEEVAALAPRDRSTAVPPPSRSNGPAITPRREFRRGEAPRTV
ncbi:MAG TPA: invasin domain 3-containing protein [Longimicrobiales bacterium]